MLEERWDHGGTVKLVTPVNGPPPEGPSGQTLINKHEIKESGGIRESGSVIRSLNQTQQDQDQQDQDQQDQDQQDQDQR